MWKYLIGFKKNKESKRTHTSGKANARSHKLNNGITKFLHPLICLDQKLSMNGFSLGSCSIFLPSFVKICSVVFADKQTAECRPLPWSSTSPHSVSQTPLRSEGQIKRGSLFGKRQHLLFNYELMISSHRGRVTRAGCDWIDRFSAVRCLLKKPTLWALCGLSLSFKWAVSSWLLC